MIRIKILMSAFAITILGSCAGKSEKSDKGTVDTTLSSVSDMDSSAIINKVLTDSSGRELEMTFNNSNGTVDIIFEGDHAELVSQKPASGIWYKNDRYELRGKGDYLELEKDGKVVFSRAGKEIITKNYSGKDGSEMTVNIYNWSNTATVVFQGETIDLQGNSPASDIWYQNDQYELRGKGDDIKLTKKGMTVFQSK